MAGSTGGAENLGRGYPLAWAAAGLPPRRRLTATVGITRSSEYEASRNVLSELQSMAAGTLG